MPRGDGTGPMGMGRMTGRGVGYCAGFTAPGYSNQTGFGRGFGGGCGFRKMFYATGLPGWVRFGNPAYTGAYESVADEKEILRRHADYLESQLEQVKKQISNLKGDDEQLPIREKKAGMHAPAFF